MQQDAVFIGIQPEIFQVAGVPYHVSVVIVLKILQPVDIYPGYPPEAEQLFFVIHSVPVEQLDGIRGGNAALHHRQLLLHQTAHIGVHLVQKCLIHRHIPVDSIIKSRVHRKPQHHLADFLVSGHMVYCL